jgi:hypothetical protein
MQQRIRWGGSDAAEDCRIEVILWLAVGVEDLESQALFGD